MEKEPVIRMRTDEPRLCERITLSVDPEFKTLWEFCNEHAEGVPDAARDRIRKFLLDVRAAIEAAQTKETEN